MFPKFVLKFEKETKLRCKPKKIKQRQIYTFRVAQTNTQRRQFILGISELHVRCH